LLAINWLDPEQLKMAIQDVSEWKKPKEAEESILLLDARISNEYVRYVAVQNLQTITDKSL
jgi:hypothetical protein